MTDIKQAATELLAAIDALGPALAKGHGSESIVAVDRYAVAKYVLRATLGVK